MSYTVAGLAPMRITRADSISMADWLDLIDRVSKGAHLDSKFLLGEKPCTNKCFAARGIPTLRYATNGECVWCRQKRNKARRRDRYISKHKDRMSSGDARRAIENMQEQEQSQIDRLEGEAYWDSLL